MNKRLAALTVSGALLAGLFAGSVISSPVTAVAQEATDDATTEVAPPTSLQDVLDGLVTDGTLTQVQADAVADALADARADRGFGDRRGHHRGHRGGFGAGALSEILGLEDGELRDALVDGSTIADLAAAAGLTTDEVVDALMADAQERIDEAVANGRIDAAEADEKLAEIEERVTELVNGEIDFSERRGRGGPGFRRGGPPADSTDGGLDA